MVYVVLILLGLAFGSFANALTWRIHAQAQVKSGKKKVKSKKELSIVSGRSMCNHCRHKLGVFDLIPVFSWVALRGKCRYCHQNIGDNPLVELSVPLLFILSYVFWPVELHGVQVAYFAIWLAALVGFVAMAAYDIRWLILPDRIMMPMFGLAILSATIFSLDGGWEALRAVLLSVLAIGGLFYLLFQLSGGKWIGGGDVKLGVVIGLLVADPFKSMLALFVASAAGSLAVLPLMIMGKLKRSSLVPFGPFLIFGCIVAILWGEAILSWLGIIT